MMKTFGTFKITAEEKQFVLSQRKRKKKKNRGEAEKLANTLGKEIKSILRKSSVPKSKREPAGRIRGFRRSGPGYRYKFVRDVYEIQVYLFGSGDAIKKYKKELDKAFKHLNPKWLDGQDVYLWDLLR